MRVLLIGFGRAKLSNVHLTLPRNAFPAVIAQLSVRFSPRTSFTFWFEFSRKDIVPEQRVLGCTGGSGLRTAACGRARVSKEKAHREQADSGPNR